MQDDHNANVKQEDTGQDAILDCEVECRNSQGVLRLTARVAEILEFVVESGQDLWGFLEQLNAVPQEQLSVWERHAEKMRRLKIPSYRYGLVGKTGSGKSTLANCLLDADILPSSAAG
ncbi:unnamed protein product [Mycena citricolor]|uniref:Uncharacterized protein n=1 Tax=Mycena citricolor TaxID=2018698 RepID=A0AAD2GXN6_9AGAR|nr:unnamed protein product [Mycena citricolor]